MELKLQNGLLAKLKEKGHQVSLVDPVELESTIIR